MTPVRRSKLNTDRDRARMDRRAAWRQAVLDRDGHRCQVEWDQNCTGGWDLHAHHLLPRARGGRDLVENGITACGACHRTIHAWPAAAESKGWLLRSGGMTGRWDG